MAGIGTTGMQTNSRMTGHIETNYPMRSIRAVGIGRMTMRSDAIFHRVGSVLKMRQGRVTIYIIVGRPRSHYAPM